MFDRFNQIRPRTGVQPITPAPSNTQDINAVLQGIVAANQAVIAAQTDATNRLIAALKRDTFDTAFSRYQPEIDLTTAHTDLEITTIRPLDWIQISCDGPLDGMSIKIGNQSNQPLDFKQVQKIRVTAVNPEKIYFTNDVRQGRSKATIYFVRGDAPLDLALAGQDISLAEQAARQGSIHNFDRRGDVLFMDDFEDGLKKWVPTIVAAGTGSSIVASTDYARSKQTSAKLTVGSVLDDSAAIYHDEPYPALAKIGSSLFFTYNSALKAYQFDYNLYDGATQYSVGLQYTVATGVLAYTNSAGAYVNLATIALRSSLYLFNFIKVVFDAANHKYVRVILNNNIYEMPTIQIYSGAVVTAPCTRALFKVIGAGTNQSIYVDDAVLTTNEP